MRDEDIRASFDAMLRPVREQAPPGIPVIRRRLNRRRIQLAGGSGTAVVAVAVLGLVVGNAIDSGGQATAAPAADGQATGASAAGGPISPESLGPVTVGPTGIISNLERTASFTVAGPMNKLVVTDQAGDVTVTGTNQQKAYVTAEIHYSSRLPEIVRTIVNGTLTLGYDCLGTSCGVDFVVHLPARSAVNISAEAGDIGLTGLAGPVTVDAQAGTINAVGLTGSAVQLHAEAGDVIADFAAPPTDLQVIAEAGNVHLGLPGNKAYQTQVSVAAGIRAVHVQQSATSPYRVSVTDDAGDVSVDPGNPAT